MDYWGLSNRAAIEYILDHDDRSEIKIWPISDTPVMNGAILLDPERRKRIRIADNAEQADYLVTNFRFLRGEEFRDVDALADIDHEIIVDGQTVVRVYRNIRNVD